MQEYSHERNAKLNLKLRSLVAELPDWVSDYFLSLAQNTSINTRIGYAYNLRVFFNFLSSEIYHKPITEMTLTDIENIAPREIEMYLAYLDYHKGKDHIGREKWYQNSDKGKFRNLSSVRGMYKYYFRHDRIKKNPTLLVKMPKLKEKVITQLNVDEVANLLDGVEMGSNLTNRQRVFQEHTKIRDMAILYLLLGTGMRVSECVGINVSDVDFKENGVRITRKGGNETILYFNSEVAFYLQQLIAIHPKDKEALFLSLRGNRIAVRTVQAMVEKYAKANISAKTITPHKLRSTFGTQLYRETGDIYLVADVLGHKDVNTTKTHYAKMDESRKRSAADIIKLR